MPESVIMIDAPSGMAGRMRGAADTRETIYQANDHTGAYRWRPRGEGGAIGDLTWTARGGGLPRSS